MRVLITSVSAYGHLQPLIPFAKALVEARHEVAIAIGPDLRPRAEAAGFTAFDTGISINAAFERLAVLFPDQPYNRLAPSEILVGICHTCSAKCWRLRCSMIWSWWYKAGNRMWWCMRPGNSRPYRCCERWHSQHLSNTRAKDR